jgi:hypothetical protein
VAFRWKDYRIKRGERQKVMRLETSEFIHRIRHCGLLASAQRKANIARIRQLLAATALDTAPSPPQLPPCQGFATRAETALTANVSTPPASKNLKQTALMHSRHDWSQSL